MAIDMRPFSLFITLFLLCSSLVACKPKEHTVPDLPHIESALEKQLAFTCAYEKDHLPPLDPEADQLYRYARWLGKNQIEKEDVSRYPEMARYYRIATANGHYKANLELRHMLGAGHAMSEHPVTEILDLTQNLIDRGIPGGYYDMARYIEQGYGVRQDQALALKYYRKAADMGNPEAQYLVGDKLTSLSIDYPVPYAIGNEMIRCAGEQGHGEAANIYAVGIRIDGDYTEALKFFHLATKAGNESGAGRLYEAFKVPPKDEMYDLGLAADEESSLSAELLSREQVARTI